MFICSMKLKSKSDTNGSVSQARPVLKSSISESINTDTQLPSHVALSLLTHIHLQTARVLIIGADGEIHDTRGLNYTRISIYNMSLVMCLMSMKRLV